jgi:O-antigen ligase
MAWNNYAEKVIILKFKGNNLKVILPNKQQLPGMIFQILPVTLFFPIGIMYAFIGIYLIAWIAAGDFSLKWRQVKNNPVFLPVISLVLVVVFSALLFSAESEFRWKGMIHYLIFFFFLIFTSGLEEEEYQRARVSLYLGSLYAAAVFCLVSLGLIPDLKIFSNYLVYSGNKSISLGIFMAVSAALMLNEVFVSSSQKIRLIYLLSYILVALAILQFTITRTGTVLLFVLTAIVVIRRIGRNLQSISIVIVAAIALTAIANIASPSFHRIYQTALSLSDLNTVTNGTGENNRVQFIIKTAEMIKEKPLFGHGIGGWRQQYPIRAQGLETASMSTPHNDYLLYAAELGVVGLGLVIYVLFRVLLVALKGSSDSGVPLLVVTGALIIGSLFNAILRDWRFGVPFMLMLAITYRCVENSKANRVDNN